MKFYSISKIIREILIVVFFVFVTCWYCWPVITHLTTYLPDDYDSLLITWSINRMSYNFPQFPKQLFNGNIFYPHPLTHAYSDPFITSGIIAKLFLIFSKEPVLGFNINLILVLFLTLYFTYLFFSQLAKDKFLAVVLSVVFAFAPLHLHYLPHLHTFSCQWLFLSGFFLLKLNKTDKIGWLYAWFLSFILQMLDSFLIGYFIIFLGLSLLLSLPDLRKILKQNLIHLLINVFFTILIIFPVIRIYLQVSRLFNYVRPLTDVVHFSLSPEELFTKFFSPVLYFVVLISLLWLVINKTKKYRLKWGSLGLMIFSFIMSLGPALHWQQQTIKLPFTILPGIKQIPLPYLFFYFFAPGFKGFRTPSRFIILFAVAGLVLSALEIKKILKKYQKLKNIFLLMILVAALGLTPRWQNFYSIPQIKNYPPVYKWLEQQPQKVIIELPISSWGSDTQAKKEALRMLYSLNHQKYLVNGYSGFTPPDYINLVKLIQKDFPNQETLDLLKKYQVDLIILHKQEYATIWQDNLENNLKTLDNISGLTKIASFGPDLVFILKN